MAATLVWVKVFTSWAKARDVLFVRIFIVANDMVILNITAKASTIIVEIYGVFITLVWVEGFTSWAKANDGRHIEKSVCQHPTRELESISCAFLEVQGNDQHILALGGTSSRQLDKVENTSFFLEFTIFPSILFIQRM